MSNEYLIQDFLLSKQALLRAPATIQFYRHTATKFIMWLGDQALDRQWEDLPLRSSRKQIRHFA